MNEETTPEFCNNCGYIKSICNCSEKRIEEKWRIKESGTKFWAHFICNNIDWDKFFLEYDSAPNGKNPNWKNKVYQSLDDEEYCFAMEIRNKEEWKVVAKDAAEYRVNVKLCYEVTCEMVVK